MTREGLIFCHSDVLTVTYCGAGGFKRSARNCPLTGGDLEALPSELRKPQNRQELSRMMLLTGLAGVANGPQATVVALREQTQGDFLTCLSAVWTTSAAYYG